MAASALLNASSQSQLDAALGPAVEALEGDDEDVVAQVASATLKLASTQETRVMVLRSEYMYELLQGLQASGDAIEVKATEVLSELCKCRLFSVFGNDDLSERMVRELFCFLSVEGAAPPLNQSSHAFKCPYTLLTTRSLQTRLLPSRIVWNACS